MDMGTTIVMATTIGLTIITTIATASAIGPIFGIATERINRRMRTGRALETKLDERGAFAALVSARRSI